MRQFAEQEIVIPDGPFAGRRFNCDRQPYTRLWFDEVDSGRWSRHVATGPTQSGKSLSCFVIPILYHLFELGETVICGLPDMDMAGDKWRESILPVIERSRYRKLLPRSGGGSRGGRVEAITFRNGETLKFLSGGGSDKSRAGFTAKVLVVTETDGLDQSSANSRESDKITQMEARTRAFGNRKRVYLECTVSTETGRTWREYQQGTCSKIVLPCPHCGEWVAPEREHLSGWQSAASYIEARDVAFFTCPACGEGWSDAQRVQANALCKLLHRDQKLVDGEVAGDLPQTDTLGFRWSGVNNLFATAGDLAADEWRAARAGDEDNAEREMRQFVWCLPSQPQKWEQISLATQEIINRATDIPRGFLPAATTHVTAAIDLGKFLTHWVVVAWSEQATGHIVDYGRIEVAFNELGLEQALMLALREFREMCVAGWPRVGAHTEHKSADYAWVDAGYTSHVPYAFCRESGQRFLPAVGRGAAQQRAQWYNRPTQTGSVVQHIGEGFHINHLPAENLFLVETDADHWKTWVHERLKTPLKSPGAMTLFKGGSLEHLGLAKHLTAEVKTEEFVPGKGLVVRWQCLNRNNHWFDALYNACAAGHLAGVRLIKLEPPAEPPKRRHAVLDPGRTRADGGPWVDLSRWHGIRGGSRYE
jgi:phage terminase large subunit GpA-like protein